MGLIVGLGSLSPMKIEGVKSALPILGLQWQMVAAEAKSGVSDQPFGVETLLGAANRALGVARLLPQVTLSLGIENGLFQSEEGQWEDIGIVVAYIPKRGSLHMVETKPCFVPTEAVQEVRQTGGTIGKVLQYQGRVSRHDDPHRDLLGISRSELIKEAVSQLLLSLLEVVEK